MNKFKCSSYMLFLLMIATLFFWTLFLPPLSELEGENALAQMVVLSVYNCVPSFISDYMAFRNLIFYNETLVLYGLVFYYLV